MSRVILCSLFLISSSSVTAQETPWPKGEVTKYTFDPSKIFPGTVRDYWVYVPQAVRPGQAGLRLRQSGRRAVQRAGGLRRADPQEGDAGHDRRVRHARPGEGAERRRRSTASTAASNTTASATTTPGSCSKNCCRRSRSRRRATAGAIRLSKSGNDRGIGGASQRGDLRLHRGLGAARCLPPRVQRHRHLRRPARRQRLSDAHPQVRAEADPRLPAGRQRTT